VSAGLFLGIDLGGSKLLACAIDSAGQLHFQTRRPTGRALPPAAALDAIESVAALARAEAGPLAAVGVGFPGLVDHGRGVARSSVMLDGWTDVPLASLAEARLHLPCVIENDVNTAALWEQHCRTPRPSDMLFVSVGTGIGGALLLAGRLHRGSSGLAGEIGHVSFDPSGPPCPCGRRGCVNRYASGPAIEAAAGLAPGSLAAGPLAKGDAIARAVAAGAAALGAALGDALNLLDVPLVVLGGGVAELGRHYLDAVASHARRACFPEIGAACTFDLSRGGYAGPALGAALLAADRAGAGPIGR
jgi:predicted NBD/HSP70 family sugar kinase